MRLKSINPGSLSVSLYRKHNSCYDKLLKTVVKVAREDEYSGFLPQANDLSPDPDDVDFFALALKLNCSLWSEDKRWKQQSHVETLNTKELLERLGLISAQH